MKKSGLSIAGFLLAVLAFGQTVNPELVSSSGASFSSTTYQLDWSIGESITASYTGNNKTITQGLHQGNLTVTSAFDLAMDVEILVYPNPTTDLITMQLGVENTDELAYTVSDINGKHVLQGKIGNKTQMLNLGSVVSDFYFLSIKQENQIIKSFKIIK